MIKFQAEFNMKNEKDQLIIGVFKDVQHSTFTQVDRLLNKQASLLLSDDFISTEFGKITTVPTYKQLNTKLVHFVGLGESQTFDLEKSRTIFAKIFKHIKVDSVLLLDSFVTNNCLVSDLAHNAGEAMTLASYVVDTYKTNQPTVATPELRVHSHIHIEDDLNHGKVYGESTNVARSLINEPASVLTPTELANRIVAFSHEHNLETRIIEKAEMQELGMGALLGVNQGSFEEPKMIVVKYQGTSRFEDITAIVGKGVTYDTGGYSLKPRTGMYGMHGDMGGAASAYGAFMIAVRLNLPVNLLLVIPATDNMIGDKAIKPGDVLTSMSKKTIEVSNTDAEGRLVLADGLTFARHLGASRIINLATLTGAIVAAIGDMTGAFTNNEDFLNELRQASEQTYEEIWQMPIKARHTKAIKGSMIADLINSPKMQPGAIAGAAFLKEFVEDTPWIHLDIAGTSGNSHPNDLAPRGGTGVMVRTIAKYLENSVK